MTQIHPQLEADSVPVCDLGLCAIRLMTDANFPWLIMVPKRDGIREIHQLEEVDQQALMREITMVAERLEALTGAEKMNVAALGNMVPQLHVHVIARFSDDAAWPGPIWGVAPHKAYDPAALEDFVVKLKAALV